MDTVEKQLLAYSARDLERFIATYSTDIIIEDGENNLIMRGHDQMRDIRSLIQGKSRIALPNCQSNENWKIRSG